MRTRSCVLLFTFFIAGCGNHGDATPAALPSAVVQGRVVDDRGQTVAEADIVLAGTALTTRTNEDGRFVLEVPAGQHRVEVRFGSLWLCDACFTVATVASVDLGDLYPGRDSGCARPTNCPGDVDCDGLPDTDEQDGWQVMLVFGDGSVAMRDVASDPSRFDTDGDGLSDAEELAARTDPRRRDTDGDGLPDFAELFAYKSNPWMVDTDGDSRGPGGNGISDPNLWDGYELLFSGTSPTLADTDGDGLTDLEEIHSGGIDPGIANLPRMSLDLYSDPAIILNVTDTQSNERVQVEALLEKDNEGYQHTDTESTKMSIDNTVKIHTELEAGTGTWPPSFEAKVTTDTEFKHGYATESVASWTEESVRESRQNLENTVRAIEQISYDDGMVWTAMKITNSSDMAFRVSDLRIVALRMKPSGAFEPVGTLTLGQLGGTSTEPRRWEPYEGQTGDFVLGPSVEYVGLVGADRLPAQTMRSLMSNPTALMFEIGSYTLHKLDAQGVPTVNFAVLGETVIQRTGLIVIDYGNGAVERHMIATNVFRFPDGSGRGVALGEALDQIGIVHATAPHATDPTRRVLTKVGSVEAFLDAAQPRIRGFWLVGGTGSVFDEPLAQDFDDIVLHSGGRVHLTFVRDTDGDSIFDREEYLLGTNPAEPDSDHDGVDDYQESKVGWQVALAGGRPYEVHPDPRFADVDADYLLDSAERSLGTDPYDRDTDGDGMEDAFDPNPLMPPCLDAGQLQLSGWWNGRATGSVAEDLWVADGVESRGQMWSQNAPGSIAELLGNETVFVFNQAGDRIEVPDPPPPGTLLGLSPYHEFSVAARIRWAGPLVQQGAWQTVLTKGPRHDATYALSINHDPGGTDVGKVRVAVWRRVWEHRWGWFFGWVDGLAEDIRRNEMTTVTSPTPVPPNEWVHVVATFGRDYMTLYIDGVQVGQVDLDTLSQSATIRNHTTTEYLIGNPDPLRIGADQDEVGHTSEGRFNGYLDDVQYFYRALSVNEVQQLHALGACLPQQGG